MTNAAPRIFFTGTGGQGTLTATRILGQAAMLSGVEAVAGEIHGMAQRGGVVESTLLLGGWQAPRLDFGEADILLGFEALETLRALPYLAPDGAIFSSDEMLPPLSVCLGQESCPQLPEIKDRAQQCARESHFFSCRALGEAAGNVRAGNTALLGALCASGRLPFGTDALEAALREIMPAKILEANLKAARLGAEAWHKQAKERGNV